jgi:hypothetical protein
LEQVDSKILATSPTDLQSGSNFKIEDYGSLAALGKKTDASFDLQEFLLLPSQLVSKLLHFLVRA